MLGAPRWLSWCWTLDFGSGHDHMVCGFKLSIVLSVWRLLGILSLSLSLSLSAPPLLVFILSLSLKINKFKKIFLIK